jgi:hypothetical protein
LESVLAAALVTVAVTATPVAAGSLAVTADAALSGAFGLEVTLGGPCTPNNLTVPGPTASGAFTGCLNLTASAVEVVGAGATFTAGRLISLGDGFAVGTGVEFAAIIDEQLDPFAFVVDRSPANLGTYTATFEIDLENLLLDPGDELHGLHGVAGDDTVLFRIVLLRNAALDENRLILNARLDNGSYEITAAGEQLLIPTGSNTIEVDWMAHDGAGYLLVAINGAPLLGLTALDNGDGRLASVHFGAVSGDLATTTGGFYVDDYRSFE